MPIQQLIAPSQNSLIDTFALAQQLKAYRSQNALHDMKIQEAEREAAASERLRAAFAGGGDFDDPAFRQGLYAADPTGAAAFYESHDGARKNQAQTNKYDAEAAQIQLEITGVLLSAAKDEGSYQWARRRSAALLGPKALEQVPEHYDPNWIAQALEQNMSAKERLAESRNERNSQSLIDYRSSMMGKPMVVQTPTGAYTYDPQNPAGGATPMPGIEDPIRSAVVRDADKARLGESDKAGATGEKISATIADIQSLVDSPEGVLGSGPLDRIAYGFHQLGVHNSQASVNTERMREKGAELVLSFGGLGNQISNADRETFARAQGGFENAKSVKAMRLSLKQMAEVAARVIARANQTRQTYQDTGRMPDFRAPASPNLPPPPGGPTMEPGADSGSTIEQDLEEARRRGLIP